MIYLDTSPYRKKQTILGDKTLEEVYFQKASTYLKDERDDIISRCESYLKFKFSSSTSEEKLRELILCKPEVMANFIDSLDDEVKQELDRLRNDLPNSFKELKNYNEGVLRKEETVAGQKRRINNLMVGTLGITVCSYCNRNFINNRDDKLGAQMDHFYNKDYYPLFAMSLYNFVPVCGNCNHLKSNKDFNVYPFLRGEEKKHEIKFDYLYKSLEELEVKIPKSSSQRESDINQIKLREAYAIHSLDVKNMLDREVRYSDSYREELRNLFQQEGDFSWILTDDEIDRMIYGDSIFEEDIKNIPLGKFRKDIYEEIKRLR